MKKLMAILILGVMLLSACQAFVEIEPEGEGLGIDIVPGYPSGGEESSPEQQESQGGEWFTNPIVIALLIAVVVLVIVLVVSQSRRPTQ